MNISEKYLIEYTVRVIRAWAEEEYDLNADEDDGVTFEQRHQETRDTYLEALTERLNRASMN